jgi:integrase
LRRDKPAIAAPRALDEAAQRRLLRAADNAPVRSRALVVLMLFTALRISEAVALDVDDVRILTRKGASRSWSYTQKLWMGLRAKAAYLPG